ncbi:MAG: hypothetical protein CSA39_04695 [Flavobacteriales bacterium]|nr:MAG: hypothetical protein CSA39_04695 [Flavobacteriales bacterium]
MKKDYQSFEEISFELKKLNLQRKIALEELKNAGYTAQHNIQSSFWMGTVFNAIKKFGTLYLIKRIFKR